jgi:hypothetical protein
MPGNAGEHGMRVSPSRKGNVYIRGVVSAPSRYLLGSGEPRTAKWKPREPDQGSPGLADRAQQ